MAKKKTEKQDFKAFFSLLKSCGRRTEDRAGVLMLAVGKSSLRELTAKEYADVLAYLQKMADSFEKQKNDASIKKMRSTVLRIAQNDLGHSKEGKIDWERFNAWMLAKSKFKKPLKELDFAETRDLVSQMMAIAKRSKKETPKPEQV